VLCCVVTATLKYTQDALNFRMYNMILELHFICGFMIGFEYVDEDDVKYYVLDLGIVRLMLASPKD
jgi:hypothetical protein